MRATKSAAAVPFGGELELMRGLPRAKWCVHSCHAYNTNAAAGAAAFSNRFCWRTTVRYVRMLRTRQPLRSRDFRGRAVMRMTLRAVGVAAGLLAMASVAPAVHAQAPGRPFFGYGSYHAGPKAQPALFVVVPAVTSVSVQTSV